ncbi:hypothetical protein AB6A40_008182 [Gnathostoma spinigerum]|uniref:FHOD1 N-terminal GTPase-binding domain-containing protein n=1 Tax=Gnathostoma spinigerum TaxID=75299 RepID=A0ABD6END4_9BILA
MSDDRLVIRVQYLADSDPFANTDNSNLEPIRAVTFKFSLTTPVVDQIPDVIRTLRAPHKATDSVLQIYLFENDKGRYAQCIDSDMSLIDQEDELRILKDESLVFYSVYEMISYFRLFSIK